MKELMKSWERALLSYETPADFADSTLVSRVFPDENAKGNPIILFEAAGYLRRGELMRKLREKKEREGNYSNQQDAKNRCFLCENVSQAKNLGSNLSLPWFEYKNQIICPNRFPFVRGHFLMINKNHDSDAKKAGKSINLEYLETIADLSEKHNLTIMRNHRFAGMSIHDHEHSQVLPRFVIDSSGNKTHNGGLLESQLEKTKHDKDIFSVSSDFDTRVFRKNLAVQFLRVLENFEKNEIIFTFVHNGGFFYLTPHIKQNKQIGCGDPNYLKVIPPGESFSYGNHISLLKGHIFPKGAFPWKDYI